MKFEEIAARLAIARRRYGSLAMSYDGKASRERLEERSAKLEAEFRITRRMERLLMATATKKKKNPHGGTRKGAGRPPIDAKKRRRASSINLTESEWKKLDSIGRKAKLSRSEVVSLLLESYGKAKD